MKREVLLILVVLLSATTPAPADGAGSFAVAGTVGAVRCSAPGELPGKAKLDRCEVELEVAAREGSATTLVSCLDPRVVAACRLLRPGDEALIVGGKEPTKKEATHVALLLDRLAANEGDEPIPAQLWMKFDQRATFEGLGVHFQEVIQDSRCPTDVVCIWQGECTVALGFWNMEDDAGSYLGSFLGTHQLTLGDDPAAAEVRVGDYLVRLGNMFPLPRTDLLPIEPSDCFVLLEIERLTDGGD